MDKAKDVIGKYVGAVVEAYVGGVKKRHPKLPDDVIATLTGSKTKGLAKRVLKAYLKTQA